jgi:hypothetical protein
LTLAFRIVQVPVQVRTCTRTTSHLWLRFNSMDTSKESSTKMRSTMASSSSFCGRLLRFFDLLSESPSPQDQRDWLIVMGQGKCCTGLVRSWLNFRHGEHGCCSIERPFFAISLAIAQEMNCIVLIIQFSSNDRRFVLLLPHFRH